MSELRRCPQCDAEIPANSPAGLCPRCLLKASPDSQSAAASVDPGPTKLTPPSSGFVPPTVAELAPLFPQLEILELLGKGGMGAVYKARQPGLDRLVALKILPPEISHDPAFAERFQREARALAKLSHPHIVAVYDFGTTEANGGRQPPGAAGHELNQGADVPRSPSLCFIVMEFVDGANLRQTIRAGKLAAAEALAIVPQICEALQFAHDEGIVHRDIKPENILIDKRGRVKIADFGLAKLMANGGRESPGASLTATHQVMGTLRYMAPEQMQGSREVDHRADIYSLGVVFYELLTGELPMGRFAPPSKRVQIDVRLDEVVLRALEQDPEQRYQHASQVKTDLATISSTSSSTPSETLRPNGVPSVASDEIMFRRMTVVNLIMSTVWAALLAGLHTGYLAGADWYFKKELPYEYLTTFWKVASAMLAFWLALWWYLLAKQPGTPRSFNDFWAVTQRPDPRAIRLWKPCLAYLVIYIVAIVVSRQFGDAVHSTTMMVAIGLGPFVCMAALGWTYAGRFRDGDSESNVTSATHFVSREKTVTDQVSMIAGLTRVRQQLKGPAIALMLYGLFILFPAVLCFTNGFDIADGNDATPAAIGFGLIAMSFLLLGIAGLIMRGGWHMLAVESYRASLLASFLGQPIGIWGLFVLSRPDVKSAFAVASQSYSEPRLSHCALVGAIWASLFFIAAGASMISTTHTTGEYTGPAWWQLALAFTLLPLGVLAPFGTTILGAVAIAKIKRSNGTLYGLRLAQADTLLFPLLLLGAAAFLAGWLLLRGPLRSSGLDESIFWSPRQEMVMALIALPIWFFPARALFRAIVGPREAFDLGRLPLVGSEPLTGKAALVLSLTAIAAHAWPWQAIIPPQSTWRVISNFSQLGPQQSMFFLVLTIGASLFANVPSLTGPARKILRGVAVCCALVALAIQVQHFRSLGEWEPGQVGVVARLTRSYSQIGIYGTMAMTGLAVLFIVLRLFERDSQDQSASDSNSSGTIATGSLGAPLAQIRFTVDGSHDVVRQAVFHFSSLGYRLIEQQTDVCLFQRGRKWAGLWETDIRGIHTILTVRTAPAAAETQWVSCDWSVRTLGAIITRKDIGILDAEGRGLESLLGGGRVVARPESAKDVDTSATHCDATPFADSECVTPSAQTHRRPKLVPVLATCNLIGAILLMLVCAADEPAEFSEPLPRFWQVWEQADSFLGFVMAAGMFAASIGLFLWKPWARKLMLGVCYYGLASVVFDAPYFARILLPELHAEIQKAVIVEGVPTDAQDFVTLFTIVCLIGGTLAFGLMWVIGQLVYFTRPRVVAAFESPAELSAATGLNLAHRASRVLGLPVMIWSVLLVAAIVGAQFLRPLSHEQTPAGLAPLTPLGTITSGLGAEFTVPAGHVATLEIVTRRGNETVPVPPHCAYLMAAPDKPLAGAFRWTPKAKSPDENTPNQTWGIEILFAGGGRGYSEATLLPHELNALVGARSLGLGLLEPNEEVIHWGPDANNLPANGLIGLRVTVVAHGLKSSGSGTAHIDWKKAQSSQSTTRRKLTE